MQDAVPMTLGQEIGAWQSQLLAGRRTVKDALAALHELAIGGTAVGTGLNTHPRFGADVCEELSLRIGFDFVPAPDRFAALAGHEPIV
ncbi:lyase family protein, partial [Pantoea agglomerans]